MAIGVASLLGVAFAWRFPFGGQSKTANQTQGVSDTTATDAENTPSTPDQSNNPEVTIDPEGSANNPPPPPQSAPTVAQADNPPPPPKAENSEDVTVDPEGSANENSPVPALW